MTDNFNKVNESKTKWVVVLTAITMIVEIVFGIISGSMALLADGIHMGSHVLAIGLSWIAYIMVRKLENSKTYSGDSKKILSLSGYTSGLLLLIFAVFIFVEAIHRLNNPVKIDYKEAILVVCIGLVINIICAFVLHHDHKHTDNNIQAAYLHVIADTLTSLSAIIGLTAAWIWDIAFIDAIAAIFSALVIIKWSVELMKNSGKYLLGIVSKNSN